MLLIYRIIVTLQDNILLFHRFLQLPNDKMAPRVTFTKLLVCAMMTGKSDDESIRFFICVFKDIDGYVMTRSNVLLDDHVYIQSYLLSCVYLELCEGACTWVCIVISEVGRLHMKGLMIQILDDIGPRPSTHGDDALPTELWNYVSVFA